MGVCLYPHITTDLYVPNIPIYTCKKVSIRDMSKRMKGTGKRSMSNVNGNAGDSAKRVKDEDGNRNLYNFKMSDVLLQQHLKKELKTSWESDEATDFELNKKTVTLIKDPFNCLIVKNLIGNDSLLIEALIDDLQNQTFVPKNNDLYKFVQSCELNGTKNSAIQGIRRCLLGQVKPWLEEVTGISLMDSIDMFCAKYNYSDYLLCHDDELMGK